MSKKSFILKDPQHERSLFTVRVIICWIFMMTTLSVLGGRLFFLQVNSHEEYTTLSEKNRLKTVPIPPARGLIYDRNGVLLAGNHISYSLEVIPEQVGKMDFLIAELRKVVAIDDNDVALFNKQRSQKRRFEPIPLRFHLSEDEVARFSVQRHRFSGVDIAFNLTRYYPLGATGVHMLGYVGRINEEELETIDVTDYSGTNYIGKMGVEKYYEEQLHGKVGHQRVETNAWGRVVRILAQTSPTGGKNLYLNIDINLENFVENLLHKERAAAVAIEPDTGAVLALVSVPNYDPNLFVKGIDSKTYNELRDSPDRPLFNRAIRGQYPPGSTIKPFVGLAGLEYGVRNTNTPTWCRGWYSIKGQRHKYRDWKKSGHGSINLHRAIEQSCDVYFYDLAHDLGIDRLYAFMSRFGFGKKTGIDTYGELAGLMPSQRWKQEVRGAPWYAGETLIAGIGQGSTLATPLQLAVATAALSYRGQLKQPRMAFALEDSNSGEMTIMPSVPQPTVTLKKEVYWEASIAGMEAVVHGNRGTAHRVGYRSPYRFAGKTGTAQVVSIKQNERYNARRLSKKFHDHALFISFAPLNEPRIAVAVIVENGGSGSGTAAPIAKKIMDYYLLPRPALKVATQSK